MPLAARRPARRPERSPAKRRQILAGARRVFAAVGFERATVDEVAARAGVSKATVYGHFDDKKALWLACFAEETDAARAGLLRSFEEVGGDPEVALRRAGERLMKVLTSAPFVSLYVHTAAEAQRFPEVGASLFERGPLAVWDTVAAWLRRWEAAGVLRLGEPRHAAVHFLQLCHGELVIRAQLGVAHPTPAELRAAVGRGVKVFLRAYRA
jgi:AcrR family transcriptional regulator